MDLERDVSVYYTAARDALYGRNLYHFSQAVGSYVSTPFYLYLPQFAALCSPLGHLKFIEFSRLFYMVELAAFWMFSYSLARLAKDKPLLSDVLAWGLVLGITPKVYFTMGIENIDPVLWACFGFALISKGRGAWLSVVAQIKIFYVVPLLLSILREGKRTSVPALAATIAGFTIGLFVCGVQSYINWKYAISCSSQGRYAAGNVSISFCVLRIAQALGWKYSGGLLPLVARVYLLLAGIFGTVATALLARNLENRQYYVVCALGAMLFGPYCWDYYLVIGLTLIAIWIHSLSAVAVKRECA